MLHERIKFLAWFLLISQFADALADDPAQGERDKNHKLDRDARLQNTQRILYS